MMVCAPTPRSILEDEERDVFEEIFPRYEDPEAEEPVELPYWEEKREALWARFHDTGIGNLDIDYWVSCMTWKASELDRRYLVKFRVWKEYMARLEAAASVDLADSQMESSSVNSLYDPPSLDYNTEDVKRFLADLNETDFTQTTHGGLEPETVRQYMDAVADPFEEYAAEYDKLFYRGY